MWLPTLLGSTEWPLDCNGRERREEKGMKGKGEEEDGKMYKFLRKSVSELEFKKWRYSLISDYLVFCFCLGVCRAS